MGKFEEAAILPSEEKRSLLPSEKKRSTSGEEVVERDSVDANSDIGLIGYLDYYLS
jgi:hypothetical protein